MQVYLDNNQATKTDDQVIEAMKPFLKEHYASVQAPYKQAKEAREALTDAYEKISASIHAPKEGSFVFCVSDDECNYKLFMSIYLEQVITGQKNHIIISERESQTIQDASMFFISQGCKVTILPIDQNGLVQTQLLKDSITSKTALVSVAMVDPENGAIMPIEEISEICKEHDVPLHCDATYAMGKVPIDVQMLEITYLTLSSHTLHGPSGIAALYIKDNYMLRGLQMPIKNTASIIGLSKALEISSDALAFEMEDVRELRDELEEHIRTINGSVIIVPWANRSPDTLMAGFTGISSELLAWHLNKSEINIHIPESIDLAESIGIDKEYRHTLIGFTLSRYTTKEEIEYLKKRLSSIVEDISHNVVGIKKKEQ